MLIVDYRALLCVCVCVSDVIGKLTDSLAISTSLLLPHLLHLLLRLCSALCSSVTVSSTSFSCFVYLLLTVFSCTSSHLLLLFLFLLFTYRRFDDLTFNLCQTRQQPQQQLQ